MQRYDAHRKKRQLAHLLFGVILRLFSFHLVFALCYIKPTLLPMDMALPYAQFDHLHRKGGQFGSLSNPFTIL